MRRMARVRAMTYVSELVIEHLARIRENKVRRGPRCRYRPIRGTPFPYRRFNVCTLRAVCLCRSGQKRGNYRGDRRQECTLHRALPLGLPRPTGDFGRRLAFPRPVDRAIPGFTFSSERRSKAPLAGSKPLRDARPSSWPSRSRDADVDVIGRSLVDRAIDPIEHDHVQ